MFLIARDDFATSQREEDAAIGPELRLVTDYVYGESRVLSLEFLDIADLDWILDAWKNIEMSVSISTYFPNKF